MPDNKTPQSVVIKYLTRKIGVELHAKGCAALGREAGPVMDYSKDEIADLKARGYDIKVSCCIGHATASPRGKKAVRS